MNQPTLNPVRYRLANVFPGVAETANPFLPASIRPSRPAAPSTTVRVVSGVFGLLLATSAMANPTYKVFFDGGGINEGSVVALNGAAALPEGACGMSVSGADLLYDFYWAEYNAFNLGAPMPEPPWGPPSSATYDFPVEALEPVIEFTGPLGDNCEDEWVFHLPLTGDWPTFPNGTPSGAGALVFQVTLPNDIEWLDAGFQVWEPPVEDPWGEDPDFPSECEVFSDLCEEPEFTYDSPCNSNLWDDLCDAAEQIDEFSLQAEHRTGIAIGAMHIALMDGSVRGLDHSLAACELALSESESLRKVELPATDAHADAARAHLGVAEVALRGCLRDLEEAERELATAARTPARSAEPTSIERAIWCVVTDDDSGAGWCRWTSASGAGTAIERAMAHAASAVDAFVTVRDQVRRIATDSPSDTRY